MRFIPGTCPIAALRAQWCSAATPQAAACMHPKAQMQLRRDLPSRAEAGGLEMKNMLWQRCSVLASIDCT